MRILIAATALMFAATAVYAGPVSEEQAMGIQKSIRAMGAGCTVEDTNIEAEGAGYEADDVVCDDGQYDVYLDKDFNITKKVKED